MKCSLCSKKAQYFDPEGRIELRLGGGGERRKIRRKTATTCKSEEEVRRPRTVRKGAHEYSVPAPSPSSSFSSSSSRSLIFFCEDHAIEYLKQSGAPSYLPRVGEKQIKGD
jgi:hypothetical protein